MWGVSRRDAETQREAADEECESKVQSPRLKGQNPKRRFSTRGWEFLSPVRQRELNEKGSKAMRLTKHCVQFLPLGALLGLATLGVAAQDLPQKIAAAPGETITIRLEPPPKGDTLSLQSQGLRMQLKATTEGSYVSFVIPGRIEPGRYFLTRDKDSQVLTLQDAAPDLDKVEIAAELEILAKISAEFLPCQSEFQNLPLTIEQAEKLGASCTFSLMGYEETKDVFGKRVAKTYLAVQVTIRNLNRQYEYLLHDIGVGWNYLSLSSRVNGMVRGILEKGRVKTPRNQFIRLLEFSGEMLGGISVYPRFTRDFGKGVGIFQGPLVEGFKSFWPDYTIDQLNRLNDFGFDVQKRIVPRRASLAGVAFIPQQILLTPEDARRFRKSEKLTPTSPPSPGLPGASPEVTSTRDRLFSCTDLEYLYKEHFPFFLQCLLQVRLAGAHVQEVEDLLGTGTATLASVDPSELPQGFSGEVAFRGTDLTRVKEIAAFSKSGEWKSQIAVGSLSFKSSGLGMSAGVVIPERLEKQDCVWKARLGDGKSFDLSGPEFKVVDWQPIGYTIQPRTLKSDGTKQRLLIMSPNVTGTDSITLFQNSTTISTEIFQNSDRIILMDITVPSTATGDWRLRFKGPGEKPFDSPEVVTINK